jgi:hypothetical protein
MKYLIWFCAVAFMGAAHAQSLQKICVPTGNGNSCQEVTAKNPFPVATISSYPVGTIAITGNSSGTTGAVVGTLAATATATTYICGFDVSAVGGVATVGPITIAGTVTSSLIYYLVSTAAGVTLSKTYTPCIPASAINTAITITTTADATASHVYVNSWGYQQ